MASTAGADMLVTYDLTYSGARLGNSARATTTIALDLSLTNEPRLTSEDSIPLATGFSITISGADSGNGTFGLGAYGGGGDGGFYLDTGGRALDFTRELIGQRTDIDLFVTPGGEGGQFDIIANGTLAAAPTATDDFRIATDGGDGESLALTSFRPASAVPEPGSLVLLAAGLAAVSTGARGRRPFDASFPGRHS